MDLLQALILGIMQGAAEFLPISSSAHRALVLGWDEPALIFSLVLHLGTLAAVLVYFWRDWLTLWCAGQSALRTRSTQDPDARLLLLVGGTVPAAGFLLEDRGAFSEPSLTAAVWLIPAALWVIHERHAASGWTSSDLNFCKALFKRLAQAVVIRPGVSRSGRTQPGGIRQGWPHSAAGFYGLLAGPGLLGAGDQASLRLLTGDPLIGPLPHRPWAAAARGVGCFWSLLHLGWYEFAVVSAVFGALSLLVALLL